MDSDKNEEPIKDLFLDNISLFLQKRYFRIPDGLRAPPLLFHYYKEINRFRNKINFIVKKTLRSLSLKNVSDEVLSLYYYLTYRMLWEDAAITNLMDELEILNYPDIQTHQIFMKQLETFSWEKALDGKDKISRASLLNATPSFFIEKLEPFLAFSQIEAEIKEMNAIDQIDSFTVFASELVEKTLNICFIKNLQKDLNNQEPIFRKDKHVKGLYQVPISQKPEIIKSQLYKDGDLTILNKGSATVVDILDPHPNEFICDICAAPGIKTNLIEKKTLGESKIIANEFEKKRLNTMKMILNRSDSKNLHITNADGISLPIRENILFDKILLDAPCTGSGTFLSNPELKWRQGSNFLYQNVTLQEKLLKNAITFLKPGGIVVYSTCSLYAEEGEYQLLKFIENLDPLPLPEWLSPSYEIDNDHIAGTGRLFPSIHGTQGFFVAKFKKK